MIRPFAFRMCLLALFVVPALALIGAGVDAQAQGLRIEKSWKCRRCGGYLGNGVSPPSYCHHCDGKRNSTSKGSKSKDDVSFATVAIVGVGIVAALGLAFYVFSGPGTNRRPNDRGVYPTLQ